MPYHEDNASPSWFGFLLTVREGIDREKVVRYIEKKGVQTRMLFSGNLLRHPCFDELRKAGTGYRVVGDLTNTDRIVRDTFWVGVYPGMTQEMLAYMVQVVGGGLSIYENSHCFWCERLHWQRPGKGIVGA